MYKPVSVSFMSSWWACDVFVFVQSQSVVVYSVFLGLDYVSHEDILPYNSTDQVPIQHELFERFLVFNPSKGIQHVITD